LKYPAKTTNHGQFHHIMFGEASNRPQTGFFAHKSGIKMDATFSLWGNNSTKVNISYQPPTRLDILPQKSQRTLAFKATSGDNQPLRL
jgi:hypothetical protein